MNPQTRQKTVLVCTDLLLEALDYGGKLSERGERLKLELEANLKEMYDIEVIRNNFSLQMCKNKVLQEINRVFKLV